MLLSGEKSSSVMNGDGCLRSVVSSTLLSSDIIFRFIALRFEVRSFSLKEFTEFVSMSSLFLSPRGAPV